MKLTLIFLFSLFLYSCDGARMLLLAPFGSKSHKTFFMPITEALAERGHHITVVTTFPAKKKVENIREICLGCEKESPMEDVDFFGMRKAQGMIGIIPRFWILGGVISTLYDSLLNDKEFSRLQREEKFDVILIDAIFNDFCLPIADLWKVPIIVLGPSVGPPWNLVNMGVPLQLASNPSEWSSYDDEMTFSQRVINTLDVTFSMAARELFILYPMNSRIKKDFPEVRTIQEVEKTISLLIVTSHPTLNYVRPVPPSVIEIAGVHINPPKPLPADLEKFANESGEDGFILFTLGSAIKSSSIPVEIVQTFVRVFSQIPQRVIWKWEADERPANLSPNVMTVKWAPQSDLLAHPNLRLFISHGGLLGTQEAIYHSVPLLGLPVVNDQLRNMVKLVKEGVAFSLLWEEINTDNLNAALNSLLRDSRYTTSLFIMYSIKHMNSIQTGTHFLL